MTVLTARAYEQDNVQHLYALQAVTYAVRTAIRFIHCSVKKRLVNNMTYKRVTLTGGEPLVHTDSAELVSKLTEIGCDVNIETNGAVDIVDFLGKVPKSDNLFFTIDYKLPSSGMTDKMIWNNFINLRPCDVIKFVIGSDEDMNLTIDIVKKLKQVYTEMPHIYLGAVYGMYDAQKLVNIMLKEPVLCDATFQIQLHKVIWDPEERGV